MHELGITRNIVAIVSEHAAGRKVKRVTLDIGKLSAVMPEAIRFCFDVCTHDTPLQHARLEINEIPGRGRCQQCGAEIELQQAYGQCMCGSHRILCIAGKEMKIREMELY